MSIFSIGAAKASTRSLITSLSPIFLLTLQVFSGTAGHKTLRTMSLTELCSCIKALWEAAFESAEPGYLAKEIHRNFGERERGERVKLIM